MRLRVFAGAVCVLFCASLLRGGEFPLRDGDVWVMAGDSITAQHLHSNYFEAFCFARYPKLRFAFRNSGVGGHTIPTTLARFEYDIAAWNPTVVSVELGMNDSGGTATDKFVENMQTMVERIRQIGARPVILSASPVNDGTTMAALAGRNIRLDEYATALREYSAREKVPYADQFHVLVDLWGRNKPRENLARAFADLRTLSQDETVAGVKHLREFLAAQDPRGYGLVSMQGDPVHPGAPGQLMMAAALLKELGAEPFVSSVVLGADGKVVEAKGCKVDNVQVENGTLGFDRLDECLPFPIPEGVTTVLPMFPPIYELSQYTLQVKGLKPGFYALRINGVPMGGSFSGEVWAKGVRQDGAAVNLTAYVHAAPANPADVNAVVAQGRAVLKAVADKEGLVSQWRGLSQRAHGAGAAPELKTQLAEMTKTVEAADEKIRDAARPQKLRFELVRQE